MDIQLQRTTQMASELTEEFKLKIIYIDIKKKKNSHVHFKPKAKTLQ